MDENHDDDDGEEPKRATRVDLASPTNFFRGFEERMFQFIGYLQAHVDSCFDVIELR
ncbi:hypothetical protein F3Y22_tig00002840pilonHSYRG00551 [Hibiscus syriacus]|uniref:Uncharacterized protein n=1 Tax=Hibiscus syriacus TaxID=106335 RepID=A0A6A3CUQ4_HIBSY|nr:hypothetical protein F3Y22_tig00002840pilonHSYRG00551 [Hibiscus syriacus]